MSSTIREVKYPRPPKLTDEQYYAMLKAQNGACALCGRLPKRRRLCNDHCHYTGRVRGLLCSKCNYNLWWWEKHPQTIQKIAPYLDPLRKDARP